MKVNRSKVLKKGIACLGALTLVLGSLTACAGSGESSSSFDANNKITVVSREDGSGTRGAFVELFGIEEKGADGTKIDHTTDEATITNNTATMMTTVANSKYSIGYISLGSLNDTVKALRIDGVEATEANVKAGTYKIVRPFNIVTKSELSDVSKDFINFILSSDGQKVVSDSGYISLDASESYTSSNAKGKVVVAGSSSVSPVMEKLKEAYLKVNTAAEIEIQTSDSTTGVTSTINGTCDIGMASRDLKDSEIEKGVMNTVIAQDGIAVIVNKNSTLTDITSEQVKEIFTGSQTNWGTLIK